MRATQRVVDTLDKETGMPRKRFYRARAHSNPLNDVQFDKCAHPPSIRAYLLPSPTPARAEVRGRVYFCMRCATALSRLHERDSRERWRSRDS